MSKAIELSPTQKYVFDTLNEKSTELANMYLGAVGVLLQVDNPDRIALSAHGIRELMEKTPRYLDVITPSTGPALGAKVHELKKTWTDIGKKSVCNLNGDWKGEIDAKLRKFLKRFEDFIKFHDEKSPKIIERAGVIARHFDPLHGNLPKPLHDLRASQWQAMDDYFKKVAHHSSIQSEEEFTNWIKALELFLLDGLRPRTAEDQAALRKIIEEGESHANS